MLLERFQHIALGASFVSVVASSDNGKVLMSARLQMTGYGTIGMTFGQEPAQGHTDNVSVMSILLYCMSHEATCCNTIYSQHGEKRLVPYPPCTRVEKPKDWYNTCKIDKLVGWICDMSCDTCCAWLVDDIRLTHCTFRSLQSCHVSAFKGADAR